MPRMDRHARPVTDNQSAPDSGGKLRLGIVGCGDVARRHYVPVLADDADRVSIVSLMDTRLGAAEALARDIAGWSPEARVFDDLDTMLEAGGLDAVIDLAPAPLHGAVNRKILEAGVALYSEKPLASTVEDADLLIEIAHAQGVTFLCAPGEAVTRRMQWLKDLVSSGRYGRATLALAQHAGPGPAGWREYTGDPRPFYAPGVGPVIDHGVYRLHQMTMVLGPVERVQAMGIVAMPRRVARGGPLAGRPIAVTTPDHVLVNLGFANGALGQLVTSFATAASRTPWLEVHLESASISFGGHSWEADAPVSMYIDDGTSAADEGWRHGIEIPVDQLPVVEAGARHFVDVLCGRAEPVLTAEHARHVLDIVVKAYASIEDGGSHQTETTF
jgi:predicted dehydrogenase